MTQTVLYQYLGTNGSILSPVHLEDIYYIRKIRLTAAPGYIMTNGVVYNFSPTVPEDEVSKWTEVKYTGQE